MKILFQSSLVGCMKYSDNNLRYDRSRDLIASGMQLLPSFSNFANNCLIGFVALLLQNIVTICGGNHNDAFANVLHDHRSYHGHVVRTCIPGSNNSAAHDECRYFLLLKKRTVSREIVDRDTLLALNINATAVHTLSSEELQNIQTGQVVPSLKLNAVNPDEIIRVELLKNSVLQEPLIYDIKGMGPFVNPAVAIFKKRLLLCTALSWGSIFGLKGPASDHIEFRWMNHSDFPFYDESPYLGVLTNTTESIPMGDPFFDKEILLGQDPRLLVLSEDSVLVAYTNRYATPLKMGFGIISLSKIQQKLVVSENFIGVIPQEDAYAPQKNWTPFLYNNTLHFVQHFSPFTICSIDRSKKPQIYMNNDKWRYVETRQLYRHAGLHLPWHYGSVRGGTNTVLLDDVPGVQPCYLTIFHSSKQLTGNYMMTYFMGALAFAATPPFQPLAISPFPIMHDALYTGMWSIFKQRHIDYVAFPMGLIRVGHVLYISLGHQDFQGIICKINVTTLLESMRIL